MDIKKICFICLVAALMVGAVSAANGFNVDKNYTSAHEGSYFSLYLNSAQDSGVTIYKNVDDDVYDDIDENDAFDHLIHDNGREYLTMDDDFNIVKNADNTANFTDYDHAEHGVVEVINSNGEQYIIVFWAKDTSSVSNSDLMSTLNEFNKDNNVDAVAF